MRPDVPRCPCCGGPIRDEHLMCGGCWRRVPRRTAAEVNGAYRSWKREARRRPLDRHAYMLAADTLRASQEAAIAAVTTEKEPA